MLEGGCAPSQPTSSNASSLSVSSPNEIAESIGRIGGASKQLRFEKTSKPRRLPAGTSPWQPKHPAGRSLVQAIERGGQASMGSPVRAPPRLPHLTPSPTGAPSVCTQSNDGVQTEQDEAAGVTTGCRLAPQAHLSRAWTDEDVSQMRRRLNEMRDEQQQVRERKGLSTASSANVGRAAPPRLQRGTSQRPLKASASTPQLLTPLARVKRGGRAGLRAL